MFNFLKKFKKKKEEKEEIVEVKQDISRGVARGMYCATCGYMEVNEDSNELPMEGFAICPNCGDYLKIGWFLKTDDGYRLSENGGVVALDKKRPQSGGHHRVRKPGPNRSRRKGNRNLK